MMIRIDKGLYRHGAFTLAIDLRVPRGAFAAVLGPQWRRQVHAAQRHCRI
jgi:hypothetical protein